jgi:DNA-binding NarL/FixJ family response regulator
MNWKPITMAEAVALTNAGESTIYMLTPMTDYTFAKDLAAADGFVLVEDGPDPDLEAHVIHAGEDPEEDDEDLEGEEDEQPDEDDEEIAEDPEEEDEPEEEEPEPEPQPEKNSGKQKARHQKIVNWYMQGRQPEWIAQELGLNKNTVIYHLHKEGLK